MASSKLYTPQVLALATGLALYPWDDSLEHQASARSRSCGSTISLGLDFDSGNRVTKVAVKSHACAIGQAAAAIFADAATGMTPEQIRRGYAAIASWLEQGGPIPDWPGLEAIAPARYYPARHGAILLAWNAARQLLPSG